MALLVAATIGHAGRRSRWGDRGATHEGVEEVSVVRHYTDALDRELRRLGHSCVLLSDGEYRVQWARVDGYGADVYLACHANAGRGDYGLVLHDYRSRRGAELAALVAEEQARAMGWTVRAAPCRPDTDGRPRDGDYAEAWSTIAGVDAVALCLEPYFLDGPRRSAFLAGLGAVGEATARGIAAWALQR